MSSQEITNEEAVGMDLGALLHDRQQTKTFKDWRELQVFKVYCAGIYIDFKRGDAEVVKAVCHEIIGTDSEGTDIPRFRNIQLSKPPVDGWKSCMVWKYCGHVKTAEELANKLQGCEELEGWKVVAEEGSQPMSRVSSKKQIAKLYHSLQKTLKPLPTDEICFGVDEKDNIKDALVWYKRVVLGEIGGDQRGVKRKAERGF